MLCSNHCGTLLKLWFQDNSATMLPNLTPWLEWAYGDAEAGWKVNKDCAFDAWRSTWAAE